MNKNWKSNWRSRPIYILIALLTLTSCIRENDHAQHSDTDTYTCPMHPTVISERPGTCPVCGMDLVRRARAGEEVVITEELSMLTKSPNETVVSPIETVKGQYKSLPVTVRAQGVVTYDTRNIYTISARVGGRLEKVYLKYAFQPVSKGQRIAGLYSPELITAQRELVFLVENDPENHAIIGAARRKLELLGLTQKQIDDLIQKKEVHQTVSIYSPHTGYVIGAQEARPRSGDMGSTQASGSGMSDGALPATPGSAGPSQAEAAGVLVKEGDYVSAGQTLFTVVDTKALRIELNLPASYAGMVRKGSKVDLNTGTRDNGTATVDFVQPFFTEGQAFLKVRVYMDRTEKLSIGQLVNAVVHLPSREALWVPREAVLDLGTRQVVFAKDRGVLKPKVVATGRRADGMIEISAGLSSSEEIASNAQYLVGSESFINPVK